MERLLTNVEAAELLRSSPRTLEKWRLQPGGPPFVRIGKRAFYQEKALQVWLGTKIQTHTKERAA